MKSLKTKLTSRKFLMAVAGVVSGIVLIVNGSSTEGVSAVIASVLGYLVAEGYVDAKAVKAATDEVNEAVDKVMDGPESSAL